ncbi:MAG: PD-(D/E)XK motif protein [Segatella oris]|uniref:PD-(D/E)XK motif protein n=1 Tax=Segatella oris TaxID=28135 RepID=UPI003FA32F46
MSNNEVYKTIREDFPSRHFIRFGDNRHLSLYIGRDDDARYSFDFRGKYKPVRISSSDVIAVEQYKKDGDLLTLRFSLENNDLLEYFYTFCQDLLDSVKVTSDDETAYHTLRSRYYSWRQLFRPDNTRLTEAEIMGLIGELLFMKDYMIPKRGIDVALESWMGPEKTHKDFSDKQDWFEVKTINFGKESVRISSIEQLDSDIDGTLVVYELEKMSPSFEGIRINQIVNSIIALLVNAHQRETFMSKLQLFGFNFSNENDNLVFALKNMYKYKVDTKDFPRLHRSLLPNAITRAQYELLLTEIELFKLN